MNEHFISKFMNPKFGCAGGPDSLPYMSWTTATILFSSAYFLGSVGVGAVILILLMVAILFCFYRKKKPGPKKDETKIVKDNSLYEKQNLENNETENEMYEIHRQPTNNTEIINEIYGSHDTTGYARDTENDLYATQNTNYGDTFETRNDLYATHDTGYNKRNINTAEVENDLYETHDARRETINNVYETLNSPVYNDLYASYDADTKNW